MSKRGARRTAVHSQGANRASSCLWPLVNQQGNNFIERGWMPCSGQGQSADPAEFGCRIHERTKRTLHLYVVYAKQIDFRLGMIQFIQCAHDLGCRRTASVQFGWVHHEPMKRPHQFRN
ncbi:MAG: hypothetical protein LAO76_07065 [Acidobacteriia bacterium]|nr:hypothetical protein [Terriglobia bacterium]